MPLESKITTPSTNGGLAIGLFVLVWIAVSYIRRRHNLPPGPTPIPIFGNALQIPTERTWLYFKSVSQKYGPIVRLTIAGTEVVVLDNVEDVIELVC
jgi:Cytochrome P450